VYKKKELPNTELCSAVCVGTPTHPAQLTVKQSVWNGGNRDKNLHPRLQHTDHPTHEISTYNFLQGFMAAGAKM